MSVIDIMPFGEKGYDIGSARNIPLDQKRSYTIFIKETLKYRFLPWKRVSRADVEYVKNVLLQHFAATAQDDETFLREKARIEETWPTVEGYMRKCPGLVRFMRETGAHSRFFYPFLLDIPKGIAMLPAFFHGRDIFGKVVPIPPSDAMYQFCVNDKVFRSVRFRNEYEQGYLRSARRPLILAGGLLPQLWYGNAMDVKFRKPAMVFDPDESLKDPLQQIFGDRLTKGSPNYDIHYHFEGFEAARCSEMYDFVSAMGLASYHLKGLEQLLDIMLGALMPGGVLVFDLQLMKVELIFDKLVLHWETEEPMQPCRNARWALDYVTAICERLGASLDDYAVAPGEAGIVFKLSKW